MRVDRHNKQFIPWCRWRSQSEPVSQKRHGRNFLNGGNGFHRVKLPKISHLFDNNLSPGVGGAPSWKLYLKNGTVEIFLMVGMDFPGSNYPKSIVYLTTMSCRDSASSPPHPRALFHDPTTDMNVRQRNSEL
jgi:hypothetical protein